MKKLVLFGDSLFGRLGKQYILGLEKALPDYDIYNCAAGGWDTNDCTRKASYISKLEPDVVVISLGTNDAAPWKQVDLDTFKENLHKIFSVFSVSKIVYFLPPPVDATRLEEQKSVLSNMILTQYRDAARNVCRENNVAVLESDDIFKPLLDKGVVYHVEDGIHLNDLAYEILGRELAKILR